ncbi:MAG: amino acid-binding protein [Bacteroidaceae bacterium]|nr:amino acid-binding protein [Bacteroidaceae bacterium]
MLIKQLSVFLENRLGRFSQIAKIFSEAGINMKAFTVSENAEFGVLHLIVSEPEKACSLLREKSFAATLNEVICLQCPDVPGALEVALAAITDADISIEYMYAFAQGSTASVIIRPNDLNKCIEVLSANKFTTLTQEGLNNI